MHSPGNSNVAGDEKEKTNRFFLAHIFYLVLQFFAVQNLRLPGLQVVFLVKHP